MKITKDMVGKKISWEGLNKYEWLRIDYVGEDLFLVTDNYENEKSYGIDDKDWYLYKEHKRIKAAPAVVITYEEHGKEIFITNRLFNSEKEARNAFRECIIIWPAPFDPEKGVWYWEE